MGAEHEERAVLGRAGEMEIALEEAPERVAVAVAEKADGLRLAGILGVDAPQIAHVEVIIVAVDEGPDELPVMKQMDALRRREDEIGVARLVVVGRQDLAHRDRQIHGKEDGAGQHGDAVALQLPPHHAPLRRHVVALLRRRHHLRRIRIERLRGREVRRPIGGEHVGLAHRVTPPDRRMRGSSAARARAEMNMPITVRAARNIRNEPARYMSWLRNASSSIGPVVGRLITIDTTAAPEMMCGNSEPISEMKGLSALRSGYFINARNGGTPVPRAAVTYCFCSSSRTVE